MSRLQLMDKRTGEVTFDGVPVRRGLPCPICAHLHAHPSWCVIDTARGLVICPRVDGGKRIGAAGWLHALDGRTVTAPAVPALRRQPEPMPNFEARWERARRAATAEDRERLAKTLGLPAEAVGSILGGVEGDTWVFPMHAPCGTVCGLKTRAPDGAKLCARGSRLGLMLAQDYNPDAPELWVTEGESDLMAAAGVWGLNAVARPGCTSCVDQLAKVARRKDVVILCDSDAPGMAGARTLRDAMQTSARSVTLLPPPCKDVRAWAITGATRADVMWRLKSRRGY
jgi:hypothetical protein